MCSEYEHEKVQLTNQIHHSYTFNIQRNKLDVCVRIQYTKNITTQEEEIAFFGRRSDTYPVLQYHRAWEKIILLRPSECIQKKKISLLIDIAYSLLNWNRNYCLSDVVHFTDLSLQIHRK